jgi:hypothetical protein
MLTQYSIFIDHCETQRCLGLEESLAIVRCCVLGLLNGMWRSSKHGAIVRR